MNDSQNSPSGCSGLEEKVSLQYTSPSFLLDLGWVAISPTAARSCSEEGRHTQASHGTRETRHWGVSLYI